MSYTCEKAVGGARSCDFKTGKIILKRPIEREQVVKLLVAGRTDLLPKFTSKKGRPFSAYLVMGAGGKVGFEFEPRQAKAAAETKVVKPKSKVSAAKKSSVRKA
jgi:DNA topoisomerase-3